MNRFLLSLVALLSMALPSLAEVKTYELCTDLSEFNNPKNKFIIVSNHALGDDWDDFKLLAAPASPTSAPYIISRDANKVFTSPETIEIDPAAAGIGVFQILDYGDSKILFESRTEKYWGYNWGLQSPSTMPAVGTTGYQLRISPAAVTGSENAMKISFVSDPDNTIGFAVQFSNRDQKGDKFSYFNTTAFQFDVYGNPKIPDSGYSYSYPVLYKEVMEETVADVEISTEIDNLDVKVTLSCEDADATIYYGYSADELTNVYSEPFTVSERCTVYACAKKGDKSSEVKSLLIQPPFTKLKDVVANAKNGENVILKGNFEVLASYPNYTIITDGESNLLLYMYTKAQGTKFSEIEAKASLNLQLFELTDITAVEGGEGATYEAKEIEALNTLSLPGNLMDLVAFKKCSITGKTGSIGTINLDGATLPLRDLFNIGFENAEDLDITGFVWNSNGNLQIVPTVIEGHIITETVKTPVITPNKRELDPANENDKVTISCATPKAVIYYTLDESEPTQESEKYTAPFYIEESCVVKARAFYEDDDNEMNPSEIVTRKYHLIDPTCNVIDTDHDGPTGTTFEQHTCTVDGVDYSMVGIHTADRGILMSNSASRISHILQSSDNVGLVVNDITIDFNDNPDNVTFEVRGANIPFVYTSRSSNNFGSNGKRIGVISKENPSITFDNDYNYFVIFPVLTSTQNVYMNSVTITYREPAEVVPHTLMGLDEIDEENITFDENENVTRVASDAELEVGFVISPDYDLVVKYLLVAADAEIADDAEFTLYDDEIQISESSKLVYYSENTATGKKSPMVTYIFTISIPEPVPTVPEVPELEEGNYTLVDDFILSQHVVKLNFKTVDGVDIYYSLNGDEEEPQTPETRALRACEDEHAGYALHDGNEIELNRTHSTLSFFACNPATGEHSEVTTYKLDVATAIGEIDVDDADARYFDLNGFEVANPEKGVYIRISNGKISKVAK